MMRVGIRGAGLAGMSCALALVRTRGDIEVTLFDRRQRMPHPVRTFCFFASPGARMPVRPLHQWGSICFAAENFSRVIACDNAPYSMIEGEDFFAAVLAALEERGVRFVWGAQRVDISQSRITADGIDFEFDLVVDAAHSNDTTRARLWQSFAGIRIEAEDPVFDPATAILMDLLPSSEESPVAFTYVLPFSKTSALVEHTTFSARPLPEELHLQGCREWLTARGIHRYQVISTERGAIPLGVAPGGGIDGVIQIGTQAGMVRAATGYGFQRSLAQVERLAAAIPPATGAVKADWKLSDPLWRTVGDRVFLTALRNAPLQGGYLLGSLLQRSPEAALVAFLADTGGLLDGLRVMSAVPKRAMIRALCRV